MQNSVRRVLTSNRFNQQHSALFLDSVRFVFVRAMEHVAANGHLGATTDAADAGFSLNGPF